jgi:hypothetical protein
VQRSRSAGSPKSADPAHHPAARSRAAATRSPTALPLTVAGRVSMSRRRRGILQWTGLPRQKRGVTSVREGPTPHSAVSLPARRRLLSTNIPSFTPCAVRILIVAGQDAYPALVDDAAEYAGPPDPVHGQIWRGPRVLRLQRAACFLAATFQVGICAVGFEARTGFSPRRWHETMVDRHPPASPSTNTRNVMDRVYQLPLTRRRTASARGWNGLSAMWRERAGAGPPRAMAINQPLRRSGIRVQTCTRTGRDESREAAGAVVAFTSGRG